MAGEIQGAAYGRGMASAWPDGLRDPRACVPEPGFKLGPTGRIFYGWNAKFPPLALTQDPHWIWRTERSKATPEGEASAYGNWHMWDENRVYAQDEYVEVGGGSSVLNFRSLRDNNIGHRPYNYVPPGLTHAIGFSAPSLNPDWWQCVGFRQGKDGSGAILPFPFPPGISTAYWGSWGNTPPGTASKRLQVTCLQRGFWYGPTVETARQVGSAQWATGECQADFIGPAVRFDIESFTGYHIYQRYSFPDDYNPDYDPPEEAPLDDPVAIDQADVFLVRSVNGVRTVLKTWPAIGPVRPELGGAGYEGPGQIGPWCFKLAVQDDASGRPVLSVWTRYWGYDPYEKDLDLFPWEYLGSHVDSDPAAVHAGQPGYIALIPGAVDPSDVRGYAEGHFWWGWGEMDPASHKAPLASYSLSAESRGTAIVPAGEVAYAAAALSVDSIGPLAGLSLTLSGSRGPGAVIAVEPEHGTADLTQYPSATTWEAVVADLASGSSTITVSDGIETVQVTVEGPEAGPSPSADPIPSPISDEPIIITGRVPSFLEGDASGTATASGNLVLPVILAGSASGAATAAADLSTPARLDGSATGTASASADLTTGVVLEVTAAPHVVAIPSPMTDEPIVISGIVPPWAVLEGGAVGTGEATGDLVSLTLAGDAIADSDAAADLAASASHPLEGAAVASSAAALASGTHTLPFIEVVLSAAERTVILHHGRTDVVLSSSERLVILERRAA